MPKQILVDRYGNVYALDFDNNHVAMWDYSGTFTRSFTTIKPVLGSMGRAVDWSRRRMVPLAVHLTRLLVRLSYLLIWCPVCPARVQQSEPPALLRHHRGVAAVRNRVAILFCATGCLTVSAGLP